MASVSTDKSGNRRILFTNRDGKRKAVYVGAMPKKQADIVCTKIEALNSALIAGVSPVDEVVRWTTTIGDDLHEKLASLGLVTSRKPKPSHLDGLIDFVDSYIAKRTDTKPATLIVYKRCRNLLAEYFGSKSLADITKADAKDFARWMTTKQKPLGQNTARRMTGFARQFLNDAVDAELLEKNPFKSKEIKVSVRGDSNGFKFLTIDETTKLLDACPDAQWRLIVALSRFGGLRTPSETLALRWKDVDWQSNTIKVTSPKTEHHEGHGQRTIPLFSELRPYLEEAFNPEDEFIITRYRSPSQNMRTQFNRIVKRAGLTPWEQPFHAMRKSRQSELSDEFPEHVVCGWLGNSQTVARDFYLKTRDTHFEKAVNGSAQKSPTTRIPTQQLAETVSKALQSEEAQTKKPLNFRGFLPLAEACENLNWTIQDSNL